MHTHTQIHPPSHYTPKVKYKKHILVLEHLEHCIPFFMLFFPPLDSEQLLFGDFNKCLLLSSVTSQSPTCYK